MVVETRYVHSGEVFVAYQISGQVSPDLLMAPGFVSHLEERCGRSISKYARASTPAKSR